MWSHQSGQRRSWLNTDSHAGRKTALLTMAAATLALAACAGREPTLYEDPSAMAVLEPTEGYSARGVVDFVRKGSMVEVTASLSGLAPNTTHGFHIHEVGDCTARDGSSAGAHFNPRAAEHGGPGDGKRHAGDLGNLSSDEKGNATLTVEVDGLSFGNEADSIVGRGLIVHASPDDLKSQPSGNTGARIACGVITRNPDRKTYSQS